MKDTPASTPAPLPINVIRSARNNKMNDTPAPTTTPLPINVIRSARRVKTVSARLVEGVIEVRVPAWMSPEEQDKTVAEIVRRVEERYRCGRVLLEPRAHELAARFDLPKPKSIRWSHRQNLRWGSCSTNSGDIRISSRLIEVPPWVLDHVIIHELAHLVEANHTPEFYRIVGRNPKAELAEGYLLAVNDLGITSKTVEKSQEGWCQANSSQPG